MNYRHVFHAGNFADVMKHGILLRLLEILQADPAPLTVVDTHAGAGLYDLQGPEASRTGEGAAGISRLMAVQLPPILAPLASAVRAANAKGEIRWYPGSPLMIARALRNRDRLIACELRADDAAKLKSVLPRQAGGLVVRADGFATARREAQAAKRLLVLIDPPYERADEAAQAVALVEDLRVSRPEAVVALWAPIKDLDGLDAFSIQVEDSARGAPVLAAEVRIRRLDDPMRLNGSALFVVNSPAPLLAEAREVVSFVTQALGEPGADGRAALL